jgi:hypothetical protein
MVQCVQRYGVENLCHWLMAGQPQLESPKFMIASSYQWLESYYHQQLEQMGRTDTLMAIARP